MNRKYFLAAFAALTLSACTQDPKFVEVERKLDAGEVVLVAKAPDGTKLWVIYDNGRRLNVEDLARRICGHRNVRENNSGRRSSEHTDEELVHETQSPG